MVQATSGRVSQSSLRTATTSICSELLVTLADNPSMMPMDHVFSSPVCTRRSTTGWRPQTHPSPTIQFSWPRWDMMSTLATVAEKNTHVRIRLLTQMRLKLAKPSGITVLTMLARKISLLWLMQSLLPDPMINATRLPSLLIAQHPTLPWCMDSKLVPMKGSLISHLLPLA